VTATGPIQLASNRREERPKAALDDALKLKSKLNFCRHECGPSDAVPRLLGIAAAIGVVMQPFDRLSAPGSQPGENIAEARLLASYR
jgi:hypothetical protein